MSKTPRTDAERRRLKRSKTFPAEPVDADFCRAFERENAKLRAGIADAYKVIDVLYMDALDNHKESWPRAREWLEQWKNFKP